MTDAIVIGGSAGVGRAVVDALRARGLTVGVVARGEERLAQMEAEGIKTASADAGDADALAAAVAKLCKDKAPRIWVNCAMATSFSRFEQMETDEFDQIVRTTFLGQVNGTRLALKHMQRGHIVHVGSGLSYRAVPGQSAYVAAKHAINGFVGAIRSELLETRPDLHLSLVQLPAINTPQFDWARNRLDHKPQPAPPVYAPEVAARAVLRAIDGNLREVLVGQSVLKLIFGDMLFPGYIDRKLVKEGIETQKSDKPEPGGRPDNLFAPVAHPARATGSFTGEVSEDAVILDADKTRSAIFGSAIGAAFLVGMAVTALLGPKPPRR
jgi:short-subunit dehydrogenase